jgi:hypothetical protein
MSAAEPERSRIEPMKMNMGTEASTGSAATPPHMRSTMSKRPMMLKTPRNQPTTAKNIAIPAMTKATG